MKAVVCTSYGSPDVLQIREIEKPEPGDKEVLIKVFATTAHFGDTRIRRADPFLVRLVYGAFTPKKDLVLGLEVSGVVESIGNAVTNFKEGDEVFAFTGFGLGGNAEYRCLPAGVGTPHRKGLVAPRPENVTHEESAAVPAGGLTALKNLQKAGIREGQRILINGASGSLGTYAIQLAKHYGAEVTAVCSTRNLDLVKSLGADKVIDYSKEEFTQTHDEYDVVYDAVMKSSASLCRGILKQRGVYLNNTRISGPEHADLLLLKDLVEQGRLKPVLDGTYSIDDIADAHRYVDSGRKRGNVALTVSA
ncbi:NAD(P)-dependent alcohol dehydrogenase [Glaciibacter superstes]|uniref:NAD(P)-dependent alcohol dehydrogenase n=1 Tax=Glaciibacter superstes TaxID=501023 RepID=UPI0003B5483A|nr:NAD(P)-dependent alcohol dehydrogenase [Glaciibacter superstes]